MNGYFFSIGMFHAVYTLKVDVYLKFKFHFYLINLAIYYRSL